MRAMTSTVATKFAFVPPNPPSYRVVVDVLSVDGKMRMTDASERESVDVLKLKMKRGMEIVATYVKNPVASLTIVPSPTTRIFSCLDFKDEEKSILISHFNHNQGLFLHTRWKNNKLVFSFCCLYWFQLHGILKDLVHKAINTVINHQLKSFSNFSNNSFQPDGHQSSVSLLSVPRGNNITVHHYSSDLWVQSSMLTQIR
ncbi:hypothetical protein L1987_51232 [Smallanthus sonchifolius]|uniref:Uncharacterized protein n=1 Tax=Smallanthus sonchifolius TaxID=185202 RepID=A0ACB9EQI4_9ASTR|nr:hypothetical protein L1987_51232 [Smallanthus sonchifolius]